MASRLMTMRSARFLSLPRRSLNTTSRFQTNNVNHRSNDTAEEYRRYQMEKPLNPHMTNTNSTISNEMPSVGKDSAPPEMITAVDGDFVPKDSVPENTERMVGGQQSTESNKESNQELEVGEMAGASFKVEPKRREGEDMNTLRARLLRQSRQRGTLESDLLCSTFADANLATMTHNQLLQYDVFLDENDWDIYYWATQVPTPTSKETAEGGSPDLATPVAQGKDQKVRSEPNEWAQTVGTFKAAYRPVPSRWKNSEILALLRRHVKSRSAGGIHENIEGEGLSQAEQSRGGGLGFMPPVRNFDQ